MTRRRPQPPIIRKAAKVASDLTRRLEDNAYFVAGNPAWKRPKGDPQIALALKNAATFIKQIDGKIDFPEISGGTTVDPSTVLLFYWLRSSNQGIMTFNVKFEENGTCSISQKNPDGSFLKTPDLTIQELISLDVPSLFSNWKETLSNQNTQFNYG